VSALPSLCLYHHLALFPLPAFALPLHFISLSFAFTLSGQTLPSPLPIFCLALPHFSLQKALPIRGAQFVL
jgi:hypothetical protein